MGAKNKRPHTCLTSFQLYNIIFLNSTVFTMGFFSKDSDETKQKEASEKTPVEKTVTVEQAKETNPELGGKLEAVVEKMMRKHDEPEQAQDQANKGAEHEDEHEEDKENQNTSEEENKGGGRGK